MTRIIFLAAFIFALPLLCRSGWVIVEHTWQAGSDEIFESTLIIQDNRIKSIDDEQILIFDLDQWLLTYVSPLKKGYWTGAPHEYLEFLKEFTLKMLEEELASATRYEKPALQALYDDLKMDLELGNDAVKFIGELPVEIVMTEQADMVAGYRANRYLVYSDGTRVEEVWLTFDVDLGREYDYGEFRAFIDEMSWGSMFADYRSSSEYIHFMKSGLPMRTVEEDQFGSVVVTEVVMVDNRQIPQSDFYPPEGYRSMGLDELAAGIDW